MLRSAKARNISASSMIGAAVQRQFAQHPEGVPEGAVRQLARLEARMDKIVRDNATIREALLLFVRVWLEYTPPLHDDERDHAAALAEARFERFLDLVRNEAP